MTGQARLFANVFFQTSLGILVRRLDIALVQDVAHARERGVPMRLVTVELAIVDAHLLGAQAIQKDLLHTRRQILPGRLRVDLEMQAQRMQNLRIVVAVAKDAAEHALVHRKRRILDKSLGINNLLEAQAIALGTSTIGSIKGEIARLQVIDGVSMLRASERQGIGKQVPFRPFRRIAVGQQVDLHVIVRKLGRLLHALGDAAQAVLANHDAVHDHLYIVLIFLVQLDRIVE